MTELCHIDIQCRLGRHTLFTDKVLQKTFALLTILRNRLGSQPLPRIDRLACSWISVCLISNIVFSEMPVISAISAILFHSCLAALSALISSSFGLFLPIFLVGSYMPFLSKTFS